jgi:hypothetical protein
MRVRVRSVYVRLRLQRTNPASDSKGLTALPWNRRLVPVVSSIERILSPHWGRLYGRDTGQQNTPIFELRLLIVRSVRL